MQITASAVSLTVDDVEASSRFLSEHFDFREQMAADGFASLGREDAASVIFLRRGIEVLPEGFRDQRAQGVILAFTVSDLEGEEARLRSEGVEITMPLREKAALAFAEEATRHRTVSEATWREVRKYLSEVEIVELAWLNAAENYFNLQAGVLGIESDGLADRIKEKP